GRSFCKNLINLFAGVYIRLRDFIFSLISRVHPRLITTITQTVIILYTSLRVSECIPSLSIFRETVPRSLKSVKSASHQTTLAPNMPTIYFYINTHRVDLRARINVHLPRRRSIASTKRPLSGHISNTHASIWILCDVSEEAGKQAYCFKRMYFARHESISDAYSSNRAQVASISPFSRCEEELRSMNAVLPTRVKAAVYIVLQ
ncbi:hypothetical protein IW261DRAFT_882151, partial [Armillaria novae-zelandiae]